MSFGKVSLHADSYFELLWVRAGRVFGAGYVKHQNRFIGDRLLFTDTNAGCIALTGVYMESADLFLKKINEEAGESSRLLKKTYNEVNSTFDMLEPVLAGMVKKIRISRMTVTTELRQALTAMKDVRKFFMESDYEKEMERLERFVELGERMKVLIEDGTLDAVCDAALKLAVGSEGGAT